MERRLFLKGLVVSAIAGTGVAGNAHSVAAQGTFVACGPSGGAGGESFGDVVSRAGRVVAVQIRSGNRIDAIQTFYNAASGIVNARRGGKGGKLHTFELARDEYLTRINGRFGTGGRPSERVLSLQLRTNKRTSPVYGTNQGAFFVYEAPAGYYIAGFFGRSGKELDAIGVLLLAR